LDGGDALCIAFFIGALYKSFGSFAKLYQPSAMPFYKAPV
jgi:hypothetical protein